MNRIEITDNLVNDALAAGESINKALTRKYAGEIEDRIKKDGRYKNMSPIKMSMLDYGLDGSSKVKDFSTAGASPWLLPALIDTKLYETPIPQSMLQYVTTSVVSVDALSVMAATLDLVNDKKNKENVSMARVSEGADLPLAKIRLGEIAVHMYKRGRAVEATYEALMYMRVDQLTKIVDAIGKDVADQSMGDAISTLTDEKDKTMAPKVITTAGANTITQDDIVNMMIAFQEQAHMPITTIVANEKFFRQMFNMFYSTDNTYGVNSRFALKTPQFNPQDVNLILDRRVPLGGESKEQAIFLNSDMALTKYEAVGSNIREIDQNIRNQTKLGTISTISGFAKFNKDCTMLLRSK